MIRIVANRPLPLSRQIATEHFMWAKREGAGNAEIMRSIGLPAPETGIQDLYVIDVIERTWLAMQMGWRCTRVVSHANHRFRVASQ